MITNKRLINNENKAMKSNSNVESKNRNDQIQLLNFYKDLYISNSNEYNNENGIRWTAFMLYLTIVLGLTGYAFSEKNLVFLLGMLFIHIGWFYGIIIKIIMLTFSELNGIYLENIINKTLCKLNNSLYKLKIIRFSDLKNRLLGSYNKPLGHPVSVFIYVFLLVPLIFYLSINIIIILQFKELINYGVSLIATIYILVGFFIILILMIIFCIRAFFKMFREFNVIINNLN